MLLSSLVFMATFCWYAIFNPDGHRCYYYDGVAYKEDQDGATDVSYQLRLWFLCGMILCALVVVYGILGFVFQCTKNVKHAKIANCFLILGYVSTLVWQIYGTLLRYKPQGKVCCGDEVADDYWDDPDSH